MRTSLLAGACVFFCAQRGGIRFACADLLIPWGWPLRLRAFRNRSSIPIKPTEQGKQDTAQRPSAERLPAEAGRFPRGTGPERERREPLCAPEFGKAGSATGSYL